MPEKTKTSDNFKYAYHVVYLFNGQDRSGTGSVSIHRENKITNAEAVNSIKDYLETTNNYTDVVILSWQPYEKEGELK